LHIGKEDSGMYNTNRNQSKFNYKYSDKPDDENDVALYNKLSSKLQNEED